MFGPFDTGTASVPIPAIIVLEPAMEQVLKLREQVGALAAHCNLEFIAMLIPI